MANDYNNDARFWVLDTSDILHSPDRGGLWIRKVKLIVATEAQSATFYMIPSVDSATDHDDYFTNIDITSTSTVTDADTGNVWDSTAVGDWMYITESSTAANDGWWRIKTDTSASIQVVENSVDIGGAHALTNVEDMSARVRTYSPQECMILQGNTSDGTSLHHPELDWGNMGRWFPNLSFSLTTSDFVHVYLR